MNKADYSDKDDFIDRTIEKMEEKRLLVSSVDTDEYLLNGAKSLVKDEPELVKGLWEDSMFDIKGE